MPKVLWGSFGFGRFLMGQVPLYTVKQRDPNPMVNVGQPASRHEDSLLSADHWFNSLGDLLGV